MPLGSETPAWALAIGPRGARFLLSVDALVWHRIKGPRGEQLPEPLPWTNLEHMLDAAKKLGLSPASFVPVVIGILPRPGHGFGNLMPDAAEKPIVIPERFDLLGLDVADGSCFSAVSGMNAAQPQHETDRKRLLGKTNQYGLFEDLESAEALRTFADITMKDHAPYWIFALIARLSH